MAWESGSVVTLMSSCAPRPSARARHLDPVVVKDRAATHVGIALGHCRVGVGPTGHALGPEALDAGGHARWHPVGDDHPRPELATVVVDAGLVAGQIGRAHV